MKIISKFVAIPFVFVGFLFGLITALISLGFNAGTEVIDTNF